MKGEVVKEEKVRRILGELMKEAFRDELLDAYLHGREVAICLTPRGIEKFVGEKNRVEVPDDAEFCIHTHFYSEELSPADLKVAKKIPICTYYIDPNSGEERVKCIYNNELLALAEEYPEVKERLEATLDWFNAEYNLREIVKQLILLEEHYKKARCSDCITKHLLTIEALAEEAVSLNNGDKYLDLLNEAHDLAQRHLELVCSSVEEDKVVNVYDMLQEARRLRKKIMYKLFNIEPELNESVKQNVVAGVIVRANDGLLDEWIDEGIAEYVGEAWACGVHFDVYKSKEYDILRLEDPFDPYPEEPTGVYAPRGVFEPEILPYVALYAVYLADKEFYQIDYDDYFESDEVERAREAFSELPECVRKHVKIAGRVVEGDKRENSALVQIKVFGTLREQKAIPDTWRWSELKPKTKAEREELFRKFGPKCFLDPKNLKFPICAYPSGAISCDGLRAAYVRARSLMGATKGRHPDLYDYYRRIADKALKLAKKFGCEWSLKEELEERWEYSSDIIKVRVGRREIKVFGKATREVLFSKNKDYVAIDIYACVRGDYEETKDLVGRLKSILKRHEKELGVKVEDYSSPERIKGTLHHCALALKFIGDKGSIDEEVIAEVDKLVKRVGQIIKEELGKKEKPKPAPEKPKHEKPSNVEPDTFAWYNVRPDRKERENLPAGCFLDPEGRKLVYCSKYGRVNCEGLRSAYISAKRLAKRYPARAEYYTELARRALELAKKFGCEWARGHGEVGEFFRELEEGLEEQAPIRWTGGKRKLVKVLKQYIPPHRVYVEPFAGAAWLFWNKEPAEVEVLNDIDPRLIRFYRELRELDDLKAVIDKYGWPDGRDVERARALYRRAAEVLENWENASREEFVWAFLYINKFSYGAKMAGKDFNPSSVLPPKCSGEYCAIRGLLENFEKVKERLKGVILENRDFREVIKAYDSPETFFYLDPPYYETGEGDSYLSNVEGKTPTPEGVFEAVKDIKGKFLLSYNDHPKIRALAQKYGFRVVEVTTRYEMGKEARGGSKLVKELLIMNF